MASDRRTRASDADRDRVAAALREHYAAGRLTVEEFRERLDKAYAAKTLGELDDLMADLPGVDLAQLPAALPAVGGTQPVAGQGQSVEAAAHGRLSRTWREAWGSWLAISLCVFMIWLLSGANGGPWFLWVALPLGAVLLGRWIVGGHAPRDRHPARPRRDRRHPGD